MAVLRDLPYGNQHFRVDLGDGQALRIRVDERLDIGLAHRVTAPLLGERFQGHRTPGIRS